MTGDPTDLLPWATPIQAAQIAAYARHGSWAAASRELGRDESTLRKSLRDLRRRAAAAGHSPDHDMTHTVPDGFSVKGVSTMYGPDGAVRAQWVKSKNDGPSREDIVEAVREACTPLPKLPAPKRKRRAENLLSVYVAGDPHIGMLAWDEETGENFDASVAERDLCAAVDLLTSVSPESKEALVISVGDLLHYDGMVARTERSGHALDADSRYPKMVRTALRVMRRCIETALSKHETVRVIVQQGNHDEATSLVLAIALAEIYRNNPRVSLDESPAAFRYFRFGKNLIGVTHGDRTKPQDLPAIMASDRAADWGETEHRRWICGHVHHDQVKEYRGCVVETVRTLAARDAWHTAQGYRAGRDMKCLVLDKEHGEVARYTMGLSLVRSAA